ncbi:MAG: UDP-3-O-(3-hydroxymyristoyl)glucosamine N-acyltransferase [Pseudomonadota bacterium]
MTTALTYSLLELAQLLELELVGNPSTVVTGIATLEKAVPGQLSFFHNPLYHSQLLATQASAVILSREYVPACPTASLVAANPYLAYAKASSLFSVTQTGLGVNHPSAVVDSTAQVAQSAVLEANVIVGKNTVIGERVRIGANSVIGSDCYVGEDTQLYPNVTLYDGVKVGKRGIVHSAAVIGSDGFGFAFDGSRYHKIAQLGGVVLGDDVEVGAGTSIDRGALEDTVVEDGVKIDNQVQIAHNVRIGANTVVCGCSAIAGSSVVGKNCIIAGGVGVINHVTICDGVTVTAMSLVNQSITKPGVYSSGTGLSDSASWKKNIVRFRQLDELWKRLLRLEKSK